VWTLPTRTFESLEEGEYISSGSEARGRRVGESERQVIFCVRLLDSEGIVDSDDSDANGGGVEKAARATGRKECFRIVVHLYTN